MNTPPDPTSDLKRRCEELERFTLITAHDLQQPLWTINGYLELLDEEWKAHPLTSEIHDIFERIKHAAQFMRALIDDLLEVTQVSAVQLTPVSLEEVLQQAMQNLNFEIKRTGAQVNWTLLPSVRGQRTLLTQLFQNLITNAISCGDQRRPEILISSEEEEQEITISIHDNGISIPSERQIEIFQPLKSFNRKGENIHCGIGLSICQRVVLLHGGKIWVESNPTQGSTFKFTLPR